MHDEKAPSCLLMALPLRTGLLAILLATSLVPLAGLGLVEARQTAQVSEALDAAHFEAAALAAAVRADAAALEGGDPLVAAGGDAPEGSATYLVSSDGSWRSLNGRSGASPELAALVATRLSGQSPGVDPVTGNPASLAWARAPGAESAVLLAKPPFVPAFATPTLVGLLGLLVAGVVLVGVVLTRHVVGPITRLESVSRRFAGGQLDARASVEGSQEVASLARTFNGMADSLETQTLQLEAYAARLDNLVQDRTRSLAESEADVERLNFTLAHELREPLRSMATLAAHALDDGSPEEARHVLELLARRVAQLERILLDLMRYEDVARQDAPMGMLELARIVDDAVGSVRAEGVHLDVVVEPLPRLRGNRELLVAALREGLLNAAQHAGAASTVRIGGRQRGARVLLTLDDEGPGVPPERREDAFHLFQRLRPESPGTGVGLAIVERVAARHDGTAWLEAAPGGGARLVLELPAGGPAERAPLPARPASRRF